MAWYDFLVKFGSLVKRALTVATDAGLTDEVVELALKWVRSAASKTVDNAEKREWVVKQLVSKGKVPESVARIAVELAYGLYRKEVAPKLEG